MKFTYTQPQGTRHRFSNERIVPQQQQIIISILRQRLTQNHSQEDFSLVVACPITSKLNLTLDSRNERRQPKWMPIAKWETNQPMTSVQSTESLIYLLQILIFILSPRLHREKANTFFFVHVLTHMKQAFLIMTWPLNASRKTKKRHVQFAHGIVWITFEGTTDTNHSEEGERERVFGNNNRCVVCYLFIWVFCVCVRYLKHQTHASKMARMSVAMMPIKKRDRDWMKR